MHENRGEKHTNQFGGQRCMRETIYINNMSCPIDLTEFTKYV